MLTGHRVRDAAPRARISTIFDFEPLETNARTYVENIGKPKRNLDF